MRRAHIQIVQARANPKTQADVDVAQKQPCHHRDSRGKRSRAISGEGNRTIVAEWKAGAGRAPVRLVLGGDAEIAVGLDVGGVVTAGAGHRGVPGACFGRVRVIGAAPLADAERAIGLHLREVRSGFRHQMPGRPVAKVVCIGGIRFRTKIGTIIADARAHERESAC